MITCGERSMLDSPNLRPGADHGGDGSAEALAGFFCTRLRGHGGDHIAHGDLGVGEWPDEFVLWGRS